MMWWALACAIVTNDDLAARFDADADGVARPTDCDDADPQVGAPQPSWADADGDGFGGTSETESCRTPVGNADRTGDCDDTSRTAYPGAPELCDGGDNDCDGATDEDAAIDATIWYRDHDEDGYGDASDALRACGAPAGYVSRGGDCADADAGVSPGEREVCDGRDEDCSGTVDDPHWWPDLDEDGYGTTTGDVVQCDAPLGFAPNDGDCDDADPEINAGESERCDAADVDEDCDGVSDDDDPSALGKGAIYADGDGDGFGNAVTGEPACDASDGGTTFGGDCDDTDAARHPGAVDACYDGVDANCDAQSDNDCDGDGYDATGAGGADCDDANAEANPDVLEVCSDRVDNDCDGNVAASCGLSGDSSLADAPVTLSGEFEWGGFGFGLAAGDFNGDGARDLVVGAPEDNTYGHGKGAMYAYYGPLDTDRVATSANVASDALGSLGQSLAAVDLDGDGVDDLLAGDSLFGGSGDGTAVECGRVWVWWGALPGSFAASNALRVNGLAEAEFLGYALAPAGDVDGDGRDDAVVGAPSNGDSQAGRAYLIRGNGSDNITFGDDVMISGGVNDFTGNAVAGAGDTNGDGLADLLIGAYYGGERGIVYVTLGPGAGETDLAAADATLIGADPDYDAGNAVAGAGDTNGDGYDDVVVGAPGQADGPGAAMLVLGPLLGAISLADADARFEGENDGDAAGWSVARAGDLDGDGDADLLIGAPYVLSAGRAYVVYMPASGVSNLADAAGSATGARSDGLAGDSVAGIGDADGDGYDDVAVASPYISGAVEHAGAVSLLFGGE